MHEVTFTDLERDALQEIMNIGFGMAAADLAEIINLHVKLSVPYINVMNAMELQQYINTQIPHSADMSMITQFFNGMFNGASFLVIPQGEGMKLFQLFDSDLSLEDSACDLYMLQRETLIEVGNIIISACVGKIAEMLGDSVNYSPPQYYSQEMIPTTLDTIFKQSESFAILFKTVFNFERDDVTGYLFLVSSFDVMSWLKNAIERYVAQYE